MHLVPMRPSAAEYEAFMERESARLAAEAASGTLSQEDYEQAIREMEASLAGLWDGSRSPDWQADPDEGEILRTESGHTNGEAPE